jgi:hypothetical protein
MFLILSQINDAPSPANNMNGGYRDVMYLGPGDNLYDEYIRVKTKKAMIEVLLASYVFPTLVRKWL